MIKKYKLIIFILFTIALCNSTTWNEKFLNGDIDDSFFINELPVGTSYVNCIKYLERHRVPHSSNSEATNIWYSGKSFELEDVPFPMDNETSTYVFYFIEIHGHKKESNSVGYFHPIMYLFFDKSNSLIDIGHWHYP